MLVSLYVTSAAWASWILDVKFIENKIRKARPNFLFPRSTLFIAFLLLILVGFAHGCTTLLIPAHIYFIWLVSIRAIIFVISFLIAKKLALIAASNPDVRLRDLFKSKYQTHAEKVSQRKVPLSRKFVLFALVLIVLFNVLLGVPGLLSRSISFARASAMKNYFKVMAVGNVTLFPEIDVENLRITTSSVARSIAEMKKTSAASWVTSVHLGMYKGELCWIATISEPPVLGSLLIGESNRLREVIIIPVTDATGEKAQIIPIEAKYGEGLWFDKDIRVHAQDMFPLRTFSRAYLTWDPEAERLVYITTSYYEVPFGPLVDPMVHIWDPVTGALLGQYKPEDAPEWVVQRWDEKWLERMGDAFGDFRWTAENELNFWNGIPIYSDRSASPAEAEGLRYQLWDGELVAVYLFCNKRNPSLLEFVIIAKKDGVYLYSLDHMALISPEEAKRVAKAELPSLPEGRYYSTPLALLYRIGTELYYHIPVFVYDEDTGHYVPSFFALVRATDRTCVRVRCADVGGMKEAVLAAYTMIKRGTAQRTVNGTIVAKYEYVENGNTRIWLDIDVGNSTIVHVLAKVELLEEEDTYLILSKEVGDYISVIVDENNVILDVLE